MTDFRNLLVILDDFDTSKTRYLTVGNELIFLPVEAYLWICPPGTYSYRPELSSVLHTWAPFSYTVA